MSCEYKKDDHTMLYIMVFVIFLNTCSGPSSHRVREIERDVHTICAKLEAVC